MNRAGSAARRLLPLLGFLVSAGLRAAAGAATEDESEYSEIRTLLRRGAYTEAESRALRFLERVEDVHGAGSKETDRPLRCLVEAAIRGRTKGWKTSADRWIALRAALHGKGTPRVASALYLVGSWCYNAAAYEDARDYLERSVAIRREHPRATPKTLAQSLNNLGAALAASGRYADLRRARDCYDEAIAIRRSLPGSSAFYLAASLNNFAHFLARSGEYPRARDHLEEALRLLEGLDDSTDGLKLLEAKASALSGLAHVLHWTGDYDGARERYDEALRIWSRSPEKWAANSARTAMGLALLLQDEGLFDEAERRLESVVEVLEAGGDSVDLANALNHLAWVHYRTGDHTTAQRLNERALDIRTTVLGPDHPDVAVSLENLALSLRETGERERAADLVEGALRIRRKELGPDHRLVAQSLGDLALLSAELGNGERALELALRAEEISRRQLALVLRSASERAALLYSVRRTAASARTSGLGVALSVVGSGPAGRPAPPRLWDAVVRSRAVVFDQLARRRRGLAERADPRVASLLDELRDARDRWAGLLVRGPGSKDARRYRELLDGARSEAGRIERQLAAESVAFGDDSTGVGGADVSRALPEGSALVSFARYDRTRREGEAEAPHYLAFVLRHGEDAPTAHPLGPARDIDGAVRRWREELLRVPRLPKPAWDEAEASSRAAGAVVREMSWDPLAPRLAGARTVFVVPDGELHLVNLAALPAELGNSYLAEAGPTIHLIAAERDLAAERSAAGAGLLALGGADFDDRGALGVPREEGTGEGAGDGDGASPAGGRLAYLRGSLPDCERFRSLRFEPVPNALVEAQAVAELWSRRPDADESGGGALVLRGRSAGEARFKRSAPGKRVIHVATHGFYLGDGCAPRIGGRGVGGLVAGDAPAPHRAQAPVSPLRLSGLALSGANHRLAAGPDDEDGILTAEEVAALDLSGVEWAVLSACRTGVGEVMTGEGVVGLRRAFRVAGARTLIVSLWSVEDAATRRWMKGLYEARLAAGKSTAEAVRAACRSVLDEARRRGESTHPFLWGGFVAAGDWR